MSQKWTPLLALLALVGCNASNRNPELHSFNGVEPRTLFGFTFLDEPFFFEPGETVELQIDASDPDGDDLQIWFVYQPPGLCFDPDGTEGVWEVPEDFKEESVGMTLLISDDSDPAGLVAFELWFESGRGFWGEWEGAEKDSGDW